MTWTVSPSGRTLRAVVASEVFAAWTLTAIEGAVRDVLTAAARARPLPDHLEEYAPRAVTDRVADDVRAYCRQCFRLGYERRASEE